MVAAVEDVQRPGILKSLVKGDSHPNNVLGFVEVMRDAAALIVIRVFEDIPLVRSARVCQDVVVPGAVWYAAIRAATTAGRPRAVPGGVHVDQGLVARVDRGWDGGGVQWVRTLVSVRKDMFRP